MESISSPHNFWRKTSDYPPFFSGLLNVKVNQCRNRTTFCYDAHNSGTSTEKDIRKQRRKEFCSNQAKYSRKSLIVLLSEILNSTASVGKKITPRSGLDRYMTFLIFHYHLLQLREKMSYSGDKISCVTVSTNDILSYSLRMTSLEMKNEILRKNLANCSASLSFTNPQEICRLETRYLIRTCMTGHLEIRLFQI